MLREAWAIAQYHGALDLRWRRTLVAGAVFVAACWLLNDLDLMLANGAIPSASWTDTPLYVFSDSRFVYGIVLISGLLVTADLLPDALTRGTASMTVLRAGGRSRWWLGLTLSAAATAARFSLLPMAAALLVGAIQLPLSGARYPGSPRFQAGEAFPAFPTVPRPLMLLIIVALTSRGCCWWRLSV